MSVMPAIASFVPATKSYEAMLVAIVEGKDVQPDSFVLGNKTRAEFAADLAKVRARKQAYDEKTVLAPRLKKEAAAQLAEVRRLQRRFDETEMSDLARRELQEQIVAATDSWRGTWSKYCSAVNGPAAHVLLATANRDWVTVAARLEPQIEEERRKISKLALSRTEYEDLSDCRAIVDAHPAKIAEAKALAGANKHLRESAGLSARIDLGLLTAELAQARAKLAAFDGRAAKIASHEKQIAALEREREKATAAWQDWKHFDLSRGGPKQVPESTYSMQAPR